MVELSLAEYRKQLAIQRLAGAELERERIIKLLDTDFWHHRIWGYKKITCHPDCLMCETLALIKRESQKDNETVVVLTEGEK